MRYFPAFMELRRRLALVVGGGEAAARKAELLVRAGADVTVVAAEPGADVRALAEADQVTLIHRAFRAADLAECALVIAAAGAGRADAMVSDAARDAGIPVNVVDAPALSTFIVPAIVDRDPMTVAISSGGSSPVLARAVRARIEALLPSCRPASVGSRGSPKASAKRSKGRLPTVLRGAASGSGFSSPAL